MIKETLKLLCQILTLALVYFLTGNLCNFIGIPNEFGTIIWPPSGISLAAVLIWGMRVMPGVFIGAFCTNLYFISQLLGNADLLACFTAFVEGLAAILQVFVGIGLLHRLAHFPNSLASEKQIGLFFLTAMLSTLISPSISILTLTLTGQLSTHVALSHWIDWYMGDLIGIFIFTPLLLIWFYPTQHFARRRGVVSATIVITFLLTLNLVFYEFKEENKRVELEFEKDVLAINAKIEEQLFAHLNALKAIESFYAASMDINRTEFRAFVAHLFKDFSGIQALGFDQFVLDSQRIDFEKRIQQEGFLDFHITEHDANKALIPAAKRASYVVVNFIEPMNRNKKVFGFDMMSDPLRQEVLNHALNSNTITSTPKITLVQETSNQAGFLAFIPLFKNNVPHQTLEEKRQALLGFAVAVFRVGDMIEVALKDIAHENLRLRILDESATTSDNVLFDNVALSNVSAITPLEEKKAFVKSTIITIGNRLWRIEVYSTPQYLKNYTLLNSSHIHTNNSWHILLIGLFLTSLMGGIALVVTGRKEHLEEIIKERTAQLTKSEKNFRTIFEDMPVGVVNISIDGYFLEVNQSFCQFVGYSAEELRKLTFMFITPAEFLAQDIETYNKLLRRDITEFNFEKKYRRKDGVDVWASVSGRLILNDDGSLQKFIAVIEDIDFIKNSQAQLAESEQRFQIVADAAPVLIWLADTQTLCYWFNKVWLDFVGRTLEEEVGNGWAEGVHPDDFMRCLDIYITHFNARDAFQMEYRLRHHSGEYRWILDTGVPRFNATGEFEGYIGSCVDIHEMKLLQLDAQKTAHAMREAKEAAEALAQSKTDFLANMSHEIRTPMNAIIGLSELALHSENNQNSYLEKILGVSENLLMILNDILEFSKLDSTGIEIVSSYFNLGTLINNLNNLFEETARQKNLTFHLDVSPAIERHLIGDALRLQQVLTNLLNNSIKFTQTGFVRLSLSVITQEEKRIVLQFSISDSGIGISPAQQKALFQPFTQADTSISRRFGGTGLGLVISQKFVQLMGGEIFVESQLDEGSHFWFTLPFEITKKSHSHAFLPEKQNKRATAQELANAAKSLVNRRVLLVEDMPLNQQVASEFLRNAQIRVVVADNGQEALALLEHTTFDVILMDIQMPVMDGLEATQRIREQPQFARIPIIAMSAGVTLDEREKCQDVGMTDFIAKPINPLQMLEKLTLVLNDAP